MLGTVIVAFHFCILSWTTCILAQNKSECRNRTNISLECPTHP